MIKQHKPSTKYIILRHPVSKLSLALTKVTRLLGFDRFNHTNANTNMPHPDHTDTYIPLPDHTDTNLPLPDHTDTKSTDWTGCTI